MNIYKKINKIKQHILESKIKKTGKNAHINFSYYELGDIIPVIVDGCNKYEVCCLFDMNDEAMTLTIVDTEKPEDKVVFSTPVRHWDNKGCTPIQILGGTQTYLRRYLYLMAFDIVEPDFFDATISNKPIEVSKPSIGEAMMYIQNAISIKQLNFQVNKYKPYFTEQEEKNILNQAYKKKKKELEVSDV